jgi:hypothetical protein
MHVRGWLAGLVLVCVAGCDNDGPGGGGGNAGAGKCPSARIAKGRADLVEGPLARGTAGDLVIENDRLRAIIQKGGRNWYNISQFGGNIIDALPKENGRLVGRDNFEEFVLGTNIESAPNYQTVTVVNAGGPKAGGGCEPAVVRAEGPDDLLDFVNGSSAIRGLSLQGLPLNFPVSADDVDLPVRIRTDYTLEAGKPYVRIDTTLINESDPARDLDIYLTEYMNGSGEVEVFQHGYGFGEAFATAPCSRCNFAAYAGHEGGAGVSYGLIHAEAGSSSVSVSGVTVFLYGLDIVNVALTPEALQPSMPGAMPNYTVPADGELTVTRWFAVGDGSVASIVDARNEIHGLATGTVAGVVRQEGSSAPVPGAEVVMTSSGRDGFPPHHGPVFNVVNHFRTDASGAFRGTYPAGTYTLEVNMPGRLAATPATRSVTIVNGETTASQDFTVPGPTYLRVKVRDTSGAPLPAKVALVGARLGPDGNEPRNRDCFGAPVSATCRNEFNPLGIATGFFGDPKADPLPAGFALSEFAVLDPGRGPVAVGDTGVLEIEPGTYTLAVSHGSRYSAVQREVTLAAGVVTTEEVTLHEVVDTPGYVYGDFHVHAINSPDSEVTNRERVATYLAEGTDFFTPSDHDIRVDFSPVVAGMGVGGRIATAPSAEVTTFDYGHFIFWPMAIETDSPCDDFLALFGGSDCSGHSDAAKIGRGATDWGGLAPLGKDFPSHGNFSRTPEQILSDAAQDPHEAGRAVVRQINHIDSHFGLVSGTGLGIDTGRMPPASTVDPAERRLAGTNLYANNFDVLEVLIGDSLDYQNETFYEQNLGTWFNLLNQGIFKTGVSDSDTHQRRETSMHTRNQVSVPATLLAAGRPDFAAIAADPHAVGDSVIAGLTTMTTAPFLEVSIVEGGSTASLRHGRTHGGIGNPLPSDGTVTLNIAVKSPAWAPYDQILVFVNGATERHTDDFGRPTQPPLYRICGPAPSLRFDLGAGGFTRAEVEAVTGNAATRRYETAKQVTLVHPGQDFWVIVMVRGTTGASPSMWPFVPNGHDAGDDGIAGTADDTGVRALAVSNPLYVNVDGGPWTAPGPRVHSGSRLPPDSCPQAMPAP